MNEVLKFNLAKAGILASLPYLARFFAGIGFGAIGDYMQRNHVWRVTTIRKVFCLFCEYTLNALAYALAKICKSI